MPSKPLSLNSLELDLENPRISLATDQRDAMQKILDEQKSRLINLAESISVKGLNPMDRFLVLRSPIRANKFIVLEGNRRLLAAKLLKNPALANALNMPDALKKRLAKAAQAFKQQNIEPVDCFEVATRADGMDWIRQRHNGADEGRGIVDWSSIAKSRFRGREPAVQALDFVLQHGSLNESQKEAISGKFPLTTLDRLVATPSVRAAIGFVVKGKKLETELPPDEALKPLRRIVLDLAEKRINVTQLKSTAQQNAYIASFDEADKQTFHEKQGLPLPLKKSKTTTSRQLSRLFRGREQLG